jgi:DNA repair protein RadD
MTLRPYQQEASDAAMNWVRKDRSPCLIEAATGAGKSHIIADLAKKIHDISKGKHVLVLQPSAELVVQNAEKYRATGSKCSIFSASAGEKSLRHPVVFGTPGTVKNRISRFGNQFAAVVVDECHGMTPTVIGIIDAMMDANPNLRVIGLSATPYRMKTGYIFKIKPDGNPVPESQTKNPYFTACVYRVRARELIDQGYLTEPFISEIGAEHYETLSMQLNTRGQFDSADVDAAFVGHGRKTASIIADIVARSRDRAGVMIFAATVAHAKECMASLPMGLSAIVTAETPKKQRDAILKAFKARQLKYLVNVSVLTTGFDAPHVDVIALMRATESVGLLQQMVGRGLRIDPGKKDCMLLDYAENLERHCPDGDIFSPKIKVTKGDKEVVEIDCKCPLCSAENVFTGRPNPDGYGIDDSGYFTDLDGNRLPSEWGAIPAHFGRRCQGYIRVAGQQLQCDYRWTSKECRECGTDNDIAARYCSSCKCEIVDPNEKLRIEFKARKRDPHQVQTDAVLDWKAEPGVSKAGNSTIRVDVRTPYRSFSFWLQAKPASTFSAASLEKYDALQGHRPRTITYRKEKNSGFYKVIGYNRPEDTLFA